MSPSGRRRSQPDVGIRYKTGGGGVDRFDIENESDSNIKYTSTPMKKNGVNRLRRRSSAPNFDSEESTDAVRTRSKTFKRRTTPKSLRREKIPGSRIIEGEGRRGEKRQRRSRRRRSAESKNNLDQGGENDDFRGQEKETAELPIAELLRKVQENRKNLQTRYEDPTPLPELTTDTLYVQGRNGFSAVKIGNFRRERTATDALLKPIHVAIKTHDLSRTVMFFCQGLLGGIALSQVILETRLHPESSVLADIDSSTSYPHLMSGIFLFLVTMSLLAAMDRIDLGHLELEHLREVISHRSVIIITFPLYLGAICIHLGTTDVGNRNLTIGDQGPGVSAAVENDEYGVQRQTHIWKFVLCIVAWFFIALGPTDDLTMSHLEDMQKYAG